MEEPRESKSFDLLRHETDKKLNQVEQAQGKKPRKKSLAQLFVLKKTIKK